MNDFYEEIEKVNEAIGYANDLIEYVEKMCMERDKNRTASELFIRINSMKRAMKKMVNESERLVRDADIEHYGELSKYVRTYLAY